MSVLGPFKESIPTKELRKVAAVVPAVEIRDLRLVALAASLKAAPPPKSKTFVDLSHSVKAELDSEGPIYVVRVDFRLLGSSKPDGGSEFLNLKAGFQIAYSVEGELQNGQLRAFGEINAVHTVWPYFRELVQNVAGRMGLPTMTVPLLKIGRPPSPAPKKRKD